MPVFGCSAPHIGQNVYLTLIHGTSHAFGFVYGSGIGASLKDRRYAMRSARSFSTSTPTNSIVVPGNVSVGCAMKVLSSSNVQVPYYLERGYDRVSGFVHRATEVAHLRTPADFYSALGLGYPDSPFKPDDNEAYVLRWTAHRGNLYRIPYGGPTEAAMRAMQGWVIERPPFRGNGFAPSEGRDVIAEFKVDSVRLPHGAQLWRVDADGTEKLIAMFDADAPR